MEEFDKCAERARHARRGGHGRLRNWMHPRCRSPRVSPPGAPGWPPTCEVAGVGGTEVAFFGGQCPPQDVNPPRRLAFEVADEPAVSASTDASAWATSLVLPPQLRAWVIVVKRSSGLHVDASRQFFGLQLLQYCLDDTGRTRPMTKRCVIYRPPAPDLGVHPARCRIPRCGSAGAPADDPGR